MERRGGGGGECVVIMSHSYTKGGKNAFPVFAIFSSLLSQRVKFIGDCG